MRLTLTTNLINALESLQDLCEAEMTATESSNLLNACEDIRNAIAKIEGDSWLHEVYLPAYNKANQLIHDGYLTEAKEALKLLDEIGCRDCSSTRRLRMLLRTKEILK